MSYYEYIRPSVEVSQQENLKPESWSRGLKALAVLPVIVMFVIGLFVGHSISTDDSPDADARGDICRYEPESALSGK